MQRLPPRLFRYSAINPVTISWDRGVHWVPAYAASGVLVIVPGAGRVANAAEFAVLQSICNAERSGYVEYGDDACGNDLVDAARLPERVEDCSSGLVKLAWQIRQAIVTQQIVPPALIVCGSTGGKVTLPLLLQDCWKGACA